MSIGLYRKDLSAGPIHFLTKNDGSQGRVFSLATASVARQ